MDGQQQMMDGGMAPQQNEQQMDMDGGHMDGAGMQQQQQMDEGAMQQQMDMNGGVGGNYVDGGMDPNQQQMQQPLDGQDGGMQQMPMDGGMQQHMIQQPVRLISDVKTNSFLIGVWLFLGWKLRGSEPAAAAQLLRLN